MTDGQRGDSGVEGLREVMENGFARIHERVDSIHERMGSIEESHHLDHARVMEQMAATKVELRVMTVEVTAIKEAIRIIPDLASSAVRHESELRGHDRELRDVKESSRWALRTGVTGMLTVITTILIWLFTSK